MVCHKTFKNKKGEWLFPEDVVEDNGKFFDKNTNEEIIIGPSESMSKSKKNVVDPQTVINHYGADAVRWFVLSDSPPERDIQWSEEGISGSYKFIQKIWSISEMIQNLNTEIILRDKKKTQCKKKINKLIKDIEYNIENFHFNVAVAKFYEFINFISKELHENRAEKELFTNIIKKFLILIYPFTPHIASECWEKTNDNKPIHKNKWPSYDKKFTQEDNVKIVIQINGKKRALFDTQPNKSEDLILEEILQIDSVKKVVMNKKIIKKIYVKNKLVNIVIQ